VKKKKNFVNRAVLMSLFGLSIITNIVVITNMVVTISSQELLMSCMLDMLYW